MRTLIFAAINYGVFHVTCYWMGFGLWPAIAAQIAHTIGYMHGMVASTYVGEES